MKKRTILIFIMVCSKTCLFAQDSLKVLDALYNDFSIPDASAATLLGITPSKVSRPASAKEVSAAILNIASAGNKITPGIAIEWAPLITFDHRFIKKDSVNKLYRDFDHYKKTRFARGLTLSLASIQDSNASRIAVGLSMLIYDKTDPSTDDGYVKKIIALTHADMNSVTDIVNIMDEFNTKSRDPFLSKLGISLRNNQDYFGANLDFEHDTAKSFDELLDDLAAQVTTPNDGQRAIMRQIINAYLLAIRAVNGKIENSRKSIREIMNKAREEFKKENWNAGILKFGMGQVWYSPDFTWKQLQAQNFSSYISWAGRINDEGGLQKHAQFIALAQYSYNYNDSSTDAKQFALGGRILAGGNNIHGSFEIAYQKNTFKALSNETARESAENYRSTVGVEFRMNDGLWLELATGINGPPQDFLRSAGMITFANVKYTFKKEPRYKME